MQVPKICSLLLFYISLSMSQKYWYFKYYSMNSLGNDWITSGNVTATPSTSCALRGTDASLTLLHVFEKNVEEYRHLAIGFDINISSLNSADSFCIEWSTDKKYSSKFNISSIGIGQKQSKIYTIPSEPANKEYFHQLQITFKLSSASTTDIVYIDNIYFYYNVFKDPNIPNIVIKGNGSELITVNNRLLPEAKLSSNNDLENMIAHNDANMIENILIAVAIYTLALIIGVGWTCFKSSDSAAILGLSVLVIQCGLDAIDVGSDIFAAIDIYEQEGVECGYTICTMGNYKPFAMALLPFIVIGAIITLILNGMALYTIFRIFCTEKKLSFDENNIEDHDEDVDEQTTTHTFNEDGTLQSDLCLKKTEYISVLIKLLVADIPILVIYTLLFSDPYTQISFTVMVSIIISIVDVMFVLLSICLQDIDFKNIKTLFISWKICGFKWIICTVVVITSVFAAITSIEAGKPKADLSIGNTCYDNKRDFYQMNEKDIFGGIDEGQSVQIRYFENIDLFIWDNITFDDIDSEENSIGHVTLSFNMLLIPNIDIKRFDIDENMGYLVIGDFVLNEKSEETVSYDALCNVTLEDKYGLNEIVKECDNTTEYYNLDQSKYEKDKYYRCYYTPYTGNIIHVSAKYWMRDWQGTCYDIHVSCISDIWRFQNATATMCLDACEWT